MFLSLPRELRDEVYAYFIPDFPLRVHLRSSTWQELEDADAMSGSETLQIPDSRSFDTINNYDRFGSGGSTIFTDEEEMDKEELDLKAGIRTLLLLNKQVHAEYMDALARSDANFILYLYMENIPERPHEFVFDPEFWHLECRKAVQELIVLARWHARKDWEDREIDLDLFEFPLTRRRSLSWDYGFNNGFDQFRADTTHLDIPRREHLDYRSQEWQERYEPADTARNPDDLIDASQTSAILLNTTKLVLQALPNTQKLHINLEVGGATSDDLSRVLHEADSRSLNVNEFLEWRPTLEEGLGRIIYVNKRLFAGRYVRLSTTKCLAAREVKFLLGGNLKQHARHTCLFSQTYLVIIC